MEDHRNLTRALRRDDMDSEQFRAQLRASQQLQEIQFDPDQREASLRFEGQTVTDPSSGVSVTGILSVQKLPSGDRYAGVVQRSTGESIVLNLPWIDETLSFRDGEEVNVEHWHRGFAFGFGSRVSSFDPARKTLAIARPAWGSVARLGSRRHRQRVPLSFTVIRSRKRELLGKQVNDVAVEEITRDGLTLRTTLPVELGDRLSLVLFLPEKTQVMGCVAGHPGVNCASRLVKVSFTRSDFNDHNRLILYVAKNGSDPAADPHS